MPDRPEPARSFTEALQEITGDSWLDDLARQSLVAAEAKFGTAPGAPEGEEPDSGQTPTTPPSR